MMQLTATICSTLRGTPCGTVALRKRSSSATARCSVSGCSPNSSATSTIQLTTIMRIWGVSASHAPAAAAPAAWASR
jgi:hypothetical protein